jgi:hypothetical protein
MVSIIIVHYKVEKELMACVSSIFRSKPKVKFEVIVVDNDQESKLESKLKRTFPKIKYVKSPGNVGFGAGNNLGVKHASGEYLFFLNPDTTVKNKAIDTLFNFMKKELKSGMVAPLLYDLSGKIYPKQGSDKYNLLSAIVTSSFVNKLFPNNPISKKFFHKDWARKEAEEFDVVPGTAFMISRDLFKKAGMFDEKFFLYFEEYDLAKRIQKLGYKNYIIPDAKVSHIWEASTRKSKDAGKIFAKSRYLFFKKHYGNLFALIVNIFSSLGKYQLILGLILVASVFLNSFKIGELMTFIGDQGWYYLSARDMLLNGQIPLVGIASSHPWLHQGAFWTYILAALFWIFNFNPLAPAYFNIAIGALMVLLIYKIGLEMFSRKIGIIASLLYATSPLIILNNRMPYHTNLIPLFTLLFIYAIYKWLNGRIYFFPLVLFFLTILYNFEIQTALLWFVFVALLVYGVFKKTNWIKKLVNIKIVAWSFLGIIIPMIPMFLYDITHGFPQTFKFLLWIGYHIARIFGFPSIHGNQQFPTPAPFISFTLEQLQQLVFLPNLSFAVILLLGSFFVTTYFVYINFKKKKNSISHIIIYLILIVSAAGYIGTGTASAAYFPLFFVPIIFMLAIGFDCLLFQRKTRILGLMIIIFTVSLNSYFLLDRNYLTGKGYGPTFSEKVSVAKTMIKRADGKKYNLVGKGPGSQFASFTMNYGYLMWWLGNEPSQKPEKLQFLIGENRRGILMEQINSK